MISVIIPAHNEEKYLNRTIQNIYATATGLIEVIVVLNGYDQEVDPPAHRARVIRFPENMGERVAMNAAARLASGEYLLRIDAHCDFSPLGWDQMMVEPTGDKTITVAVLTALDKNWNRLKGHWYGMCRLMPNMEAKWLKPNRDHLGYKTVEPNMAFTGCGWLIPTEFYWQLGGADESMPKMGAIGEEFAVKAWLAGGKVQTRSDIIIGHIFGTGAYSTADVKKAQEMLVEKYGNRYWEIVDKFPDVNVVPLRSAANVKEKRAVIVNRWDTTETKDEAGKVIMKLVEHFRHIWIDDGSGMTADQVREKYAPLAPKVGEERWIVDDAGTFIPVVLDADQPLYEYAKPALESPKIITPTLLVPTKD
jgi:glycosyltransferase involved in cell wall biosynthesis